MIDRPILLLQSQVAVKIYDKQDARRLLNASHEVLTHSIASRHFNVVSIHTTSFFFLTQYR